MAKKADAWKEYQEAALVDMMLQVRHLLTLSMRLWYHDMTFSGVA